MTQLENESAAQQNFQDLLNQIAKGCHQSAATLYRQHQKSVYAFIRLRVGNEQASEEILNDTFMVAFRRPHRYDQSCEYRTWLIGIAKRLCSNWQRQQTRQSMVESDPLDDINLDSVPSESLTALQRIEERELRQVLYGCIDKLPERQREAIYWALHQELKMADIANTMRCSEGAIKAHLHHARKKVTQCVARVLGVLSHA